ncbi:PH domain-containing protein [Phragmitibacter flavus]|uniref:PH domain-containing protein n=1 Tax=Phragmitibacter flavus TaxID=2576071 RepID=A0A5R8KBJ3_9BACT|nr:PH domain-containing protein [Phragmitibacter flavus]TLD69627.1 PH domain-containing protein [Phragmitibacter flavus]
MEATRYFVPDHPTLSDVYSRDELRHFLQRGELSRSDMICDDETGLAHLLGDLLSLPYRDATLAPSRTTRSSVSELTAPNSNSHEFRADTPLTAAHHHHPSPPPTRSRETSSFDDNHETEGDVDDPLDDEDDNLDSDPDPDPNEDDENQDLRPFNPFGQSDIPQFEEDINADELAYPSSSYPPSSAEEEILYIGHPSWLSFPKSLIGFTLFAAATVYVLAAQIGLEWAMLLGSIAGLFLVFITLERTTTTYFVTSYRIEIEFGIIGRNTKEVRIRDIRAIDVHQRGYKALVGLGTVEFDSSASSGPEVIFTNVRHPHQIKELVRSLQLRR